MKPLNKRLPQYWVVLMTDRNDKRFKKVLTYMNAKSPRFIDWVGMKGCPYYGYDGNEIYNGFNAFKTPDDCINKPVLLTLDEFDKIYSYTGKFRSDIEPQSMYYVNYVVNNEGDRVYKPTAIKGCDLTENQSITAELI